MDHIKVPEVNIFVLKKVKPVKGVFMGFPVFSMASIEVGGVNIGMDTFLKSFKYEYNDEGDEGELTFNFPTTALDLRYFKDGIRLAIAWGYRGSSKTYRDVTISEAKGRYTRSGYSITIKVVSTAFYLENNEDPDIGRALSEVGGYIGFEYYDKESRSFLKYQYYPGTGEWDVSGVVKDRRGQSEEKEGNSLKWYFTHSPATVAGGASTAVPYRTRTDGPSAYEGHNWDLAQLKKDSRKETIEEAYTKFLTLMGVQADVYYRDNQIVNKVGVEDSPSIRVFSIGSGQYSQVISFSFEAGKGSSDAEAEAKVELAKLDPNNKTEKEIDISGKYSITAAEEQGEWDFKVVKVDGVWRFKSGGDIDPVWAYNPNAEIPEEKILNPLTDMQILKFKRLVKESKFQEYKTSLDQDEYNREALGEPKGVRPGRDRVVEIESDEAFTRAWDSPYPFIKHFPLKDEVSIEDYKILGEIDLEAPFTETDAKKFILQSYTSGTLMEARNRTIDNRLASILNNITCQLTIEGDPQLGHRFKFNVTGVGTGVSGAFVCNKSIHNIVAGKYTTTLHGGRIPDSSIETIVKEVTSSIEEQVGEIIKSKGLFDNLSVITSVIGNLESAEMPESIKGVLLALGIKADEIEVSYKKDIQDTGREQTSNYVARDADDLVNLVHNPERLEGALQTEMKAVEIMERSEYFLDPPLSETTTIPSIRGTFVTKEDLRLKDPNLDYFDDYMTTVDSSFFYKLRGMTNTSGNE